jgi:hypothetical protein
MWPTPNLCSEASNRFMQVQTVRRIGAVVRIVDAYPYTLPYRAAPAALSTS